MGIHDLPAVSATLNAIATFMLFGGYWAIKFKNDKKLHRSFISKKEIFVK